MMHKSLLDNLICFYCISNYDKNLEKRLKAFIFEESPDKKRIVNGCLYCEDCKRYYPIDDTILFMQPDHARKPEFDKGFLTKYKKMLPQEILKSGIPHNLNLQND